MVACLHRRPIPTNDVRSATDACEDFGCCCFSTRALSKRTYEPRALQGVACSERLPKHEATGVAQAQVDAHAWVPGPEVLPSAENSQSPTEHRTGAPRLIARGIFLNPAVCAPKESWTPWGPPRRWVIAHVCTCFCERLFATLSGLAQRSNGTPCRALACAPHPTGAAHRLRLCAATLLARTVAVFWRALFSVFFSPCRASCACARPRLTSLSVAPNTRPSSAPGARPPASLQQLAAALPAPPAPAPAELKTLLVALTKASAETSAKLDALLAEVAVLRTLSTPASTRKVRLVWSVRSPHACTRPFRLPRSPL